jgi:hypothetical protein
MKTEIFLQTGLDRNLVICLSKQLVGEIGRVGKARNVPAIYGTGHEMVGMAQERLCPPDALPRPILMKSLYLGALAHLAFKWRFDHFGKAAHGLRPRSMRDDAMLLLSDYRDSSELGDRLRNADAATAELIADIIGTTCRRFPSAGQSAKTAQIERLIGAEAWTDAGLALIDLELPHWQVRRIAYDEGEWHCALSRQRELPEWLDQSIEVHHADLPLAILSAFVETMRVTAPRSRTSVPTVPREANAFYEPVCCDNFG